MGTSTRPTGSSRWPWWWPAPCWWPLDKYRETYSTVQLFVMQLEGHCEEALWQYALTLRRTLSSQHVAKSEDFELLLPVLYPTSQEDERAALLSTFNRFMHTLPQQYGIGPGELPVRDLIVEFLCGSLLSKTEPRFKKWVKVFKWKDTHHRNSFRRLEYIEIASKLFASLSRGTIAAGYNVAVFKIGTDKARAAAAAESLVGPRGRDGAGEQGGTHLPSSGPTIPAPRGSCLLLYPPAPLAPDARRALVFPLSLALNPTRLPRAGPLGVARAPHLPLRCHPPVPPGRPQPQERRGGPPRRRRERRRADEQHRGRGRGGGQAAEAGREVRDRAACVWDGPLRQAMRAPRRLLKHPPSLPPSLPVLFLSRIPVLASPRPSPSEQ